MSHQSVTPKPIPLFTSLFSVGPILHGDGEARVHDAERDVDRLVRVLVVVVAVLQQAVAVAMQIFALPELLSEFTLAPF